METRLPRKGSFERKRRVPVNQGHWFDLSYDNRHHQKRSSHSPSHPLYSAHARHETRPNSYSARRRWPPAPCVEDESKSLAREKSPPPALDPRDEAQSRGLVDQMPILENAFGQSQEARHTPDSQGSSGTSSGRETPLTSHSHSDERRFVLLSHEQPSSTQAFTGEASFSKDGTDGSLLSPKPVKANAGINLDKLSPKRSQEPSPSTTPADSRQNRADHYASPAATAQPVSDIRSRGDSIQPGRETQLKYTPEQYKTASDPLRRSPIGIPTPKGQYTTGQRPRAPQPTFEERDRTPRGENYPGNPYDSGRTPVPQTQPYSQSNSKSDCRKTSPARSIRSSQYSLTGTELRQTDTESAQRRHSTVPKEAAKSSRPVQVPDPSIQRGYRPDEDPATYSWSVPDRTCFPVDSGRSPKSTQFSPRPSPHQSPRATPPPGSTQEYSKYNGWSSPYQYAQSNSRPTTPSMLSPNTANFSSYNDARLRASSSASASSNISSSQKLPTATNESQPQMIEIKKNPANSLFNLKTRQTAPLPALVTTSFADAEATAPVNIPHSASPGRSSYQPLDSSRPTSREGFPNASPGKQTHQSLNNSRPTSREGPTIAPPQGRAASKAASISQPPVPAQKEADDESRRRSSAAPAKPSLDSARASQRSKSVQPREVPILPACPRPNFVAGYSDWSTLPGHPNFDVCPSCRKGLENAGSAAKFIASPKRAEDYSTKCDLSTQWVRMAWLLVLQSRPTHVTVVDQITTILANDPPCPGNQLSPRIWYGIIDKETSKFLPNFDACPTCVRLLEALFPNLRGMLQRTSSDPKQLRTCDLRVDSRRFVRYLDLLDSISNQGHSARREPNMTPFVQLAQRLTLVRECREDDQLIDQAWHFMPQLPDFTVCEECYKDEIWPQIQQNSDVATKFNRRLDFPPHGSIPLSCQLYSPRMREVWRAACQKGDYETLKTAVLQRVAKERELQTRHMQLTNWPEEQRLEEGRRLVAEWRRWA